MTILLEAEVERPTRHINSHFGNNTVKHYISAAS